MLRVVVILFLFKPHTTIGDLSCAGCVNSGPLPENLDWRLANVISPVKNQGTCPACWAFSVIANIESHLTIYTGKQSRLSEQFLIDCSGNSNSCGSASLIQTFADIITKFGGVLNEFDYPPYEENQSECRWSRKFGESNNGSLQISNQLDWPGPSLVPVIGFKRVLKNEVAMAEAVYRCGPLSAAINSASMAFYKGGIDEPTDLTCDPKHLDHAVLIVGYGVVTDYKDNTIKHYWIIKNSWGVDWGEHGYYYLIRGRNACGISSDASYAIMS